MKRFFASMLCVLMVLASFSAFAIANPWTETTADEMVTTLGFGFGIPQDAEDVVYSMNTEIGMGQATFTVNGLEYTVRMASSSITDEIEDISGMNYEWELVEDVEIEGRPGKLMQAQDGDNTVEVCIWLDVVPGFVYSISTVQSDVDGLDLTAFALEVFQPMQGEA